MTAKGGDFKKISNITKAFDKWKDEWKKKSLKDEDAIYEAYRYTKNKKKINEYFLNILMLHLFKMLMNVLMIICGNKILLIH